MLVVKRATKCRTITKIQMKNIGLFPMKTNQIIFTLLFILSSDSTAWIVGRELHSIVVERKVSSYPLLHSTQLSCTQTKEEAKGNVLSLLLFLISVHFRSYYAFVSRAEHCCYRETVNTTIYCIDCL